MLIQEVIACIQGNCLGMTYYKKVDELHNSVVEIKCKKTKTSDLLLEI